MVLNNVLHTPRIVITLPVNRMSSFNSGWPEEAATAEAEYMAINDVTRNLVGGGRSLNIPIRLRSPSTIRELSH